MTTRPPWQEALSAYADPTMSRGLLEVATSALPYLGVSAAIYFTLGVSPLLTLALVILAAGFLVRVFVVFHDCTHGSLFPSKARERPCRDRARTVRPLAVSPLASRPCRAPRHLGRS